VADETELTELKARIAALELTTVVQVLLDASAATGFDAEDFAAGRRDFWNAIGVALNDEGDAFSASLEKALARMGDLLVSFAKPLAEEQRASPDTRDLHFSPLADRLKAGGA